MKKRWLLILSILCVGLLFAACRKEKTPNEEPSATDETASPDAFPIAEATVIRPSKTPDIIITASQSLNSGLTELCGVDIRMKDDYISSVNPPDPNAYEILVGDTNRDASVAASELLAGEEFAYYIGRTGNKIVILGTTAEMTVQGIQHFLEQYVTDHLVNGSLEIAPGFSHIGKADAVTIANAGETDYSIVTSVRFQGSGVTANINQLNEAIRSVISKSAQITIDTKGEDEARDDSAKEFLLGYTDYPQTQNYIRTLNYNEYGIAVDGNKVVIFGFSDELVSKAIALFADVLERNVQPDQTIRLPAGMKLCLSDSSLKADLPYFPDGTQKLVSVGGDGNMIYVSDTDETAFREYGGILTSNGFTLYTENTLGSSLFATYINQALTVNVGFDPTDSTVRILVDAITERPARAEDNSYTATTQTLLTQVGLNYIKNDTGMSYFMRLSDGRFLVFDGGADDVDDHIKLYRLLLSQCEEGEKPVIAAWFLTHAHADHFQVFLSMAQEFASELTIQSVVYNLPSSNLGEIDLALVETVDKGIKAIPGAKIIYARTGQQYHIGNAVIDVLFTPEDAYPTYIRSTNDTSVIFRVSCEGQTFMVLGDTEALGASILCRRYGSFLKSDIMQMAHHGYTGGSNELFALIDPETVLWPCPDHWFHETLTWDCNRFIATSPNVGEIINAGHGTAVLQLPYTPKTSVGPDYSVGDIIYHEDFEDLSQIYETGWFSVNSLTETMQYTDLLLKNVNGDRGILMNGYDNSVLCFLRPDELQNVSVYTLELKLRVNHLGSGFAIWYNDASPIDSAGKASYHVTGTGTLTLVLEVDRTTGTTRVLINGAEVQTLTNASNDAGGLIFHSRNAEVFVGEITVSAGTLADRNDA